MILTGRQVREGRILAGLSQADLATAAEVALGLTARVEAVDGMAMAKKPDLAAIQEALEAAGVGILLAGRQWCGRQASEERAHRLHGKPDRRRREVAQGRDVPLQVHHRRLGQRHGYASTPAP